MWKLNNNHLQNKANNSVAGVDWFGGFCIII